MSVGIARAIGAMTHGSERTAPSAGVRILVVDDDAGVRDVLHALLSEEGYSVQVSANAEAALRLVPEFDPEILKPIKEQVAGRQPGSDGLFDAIADRLPVALTGEQPRQAPPVTFKVEAFHLQFPVFHAEAGSDPAIKEPLADPRQKRHVTH